MAKANYLSDSESQNLCVVTFDVFAIDVLQIPTITLRGGNELDEYKSPSPFDLSLDKITDAYLEAYPWGINYLDAQSWRHYLPYLVEYALRHLDEGGFVVECLISSLRPPDREPPRLGSLTSRQKIKISQLLHILAFDPRSAHQEFACQVLEEWWIPDALYRKSNS